MQRNLRITFCDENGERFFGEGPFRLLSGVEQNGSLHLTAGEMEMSYSKALRIIGNAEKVLGFPLLRRKSGGSGGGGSVLTPEGKEWVRKYEEYRERCRRAEEEIFRNLYPEYSSGAVIMASGEGKRFGGNKPMALFRGSPMIARTLEATSDLFLCRVAVTRSEETAAYLREKGICTVLHELPGRNDTIRLGLEKVMEKEVAGCLFCPADQPLLSREMLRKLLLCTKEEPDKIWRLSSAEGPGTPVWFPKHLFPELLSLPEGTGGRAVIQRHPDLSRSLEVADARELRDADTREELFLLEKEEAE